MKILVTGGAGFIGGAVVRHLLAATDHEVVNLDALTYAANLASLEGAEGNRRYRLEKVDIRDDAAVRAAVARHGPDAIMHLAAESHVDRSIDGPAAFVATNVVGTYHLLDAALEHWRTLKGERQARFRFHHISSDEVFGALRPDDPPFDEATPYRPRSPYAASKASSDHLVLAWHHTYGLPAVLSNCSNNYGPYQFPEKLIPLMIVRALAGQPLPLYGRGENVRDWLHVEDHVRALTLVLERGQVGQTYLVGGNAERRNVDIVRDICAYLDEILPDSPHRPHEKLIAFVADRPGHDLRYAIDAERIRTELNWRPAVSLAQGLRQTVAWYLRRRDWWEPLVRERAATERLGLGRKEGTR